MHRAQVWLDNAANIPMETGLFSYSELPQEKLKYFTLNWPVIIIKWKREWIGLSRNMKPCIIANDLPQTRKTPLKLVKQDKNMLWNCKYHKAAIMLTDRRLDSVHSGENFFLFAVKQLARHLIRSQKLQVHKMNVTPAG